MKKHALLLAAGAALFHLAFLPPGNFCTDGNSMLAAAESFLRDGTPSVPENLGRVGVGGRFFSLWYPLLSLLSLPFAAAGHFLGRAAGLPEHYLATVLALLISVGFTAATAALVYLLALRFGSGGRGAWLAALAYALGSVSLAYGRTLFADPLLAFLVALAFLLAFRPEGAPGIKLFILSGLALLAKPAGILLGPFLCLHLFFRHRKIAPALLPGLGALAGFFLYALYNRYRFGNALDFGQPNQFSFAAIPGGVAGILLSPGRGLLWYSPPLWLGLWGLLSRQKEKKAVPWALILFSLSFLLLHAFWVQWHGGWSWGSRLLLPLIPLLMAAGGAVMERYPRRSAALIALGFLINAPTLFWFYQHYFEKRTETGITEKTLLWSPAEAPLLRAWPDAVDQIKEAGNYDVKGVAANAGKSGADNELFKVVALWWWMVPLAGIPRWAGAFTALMMAAGGLWLAWKARPPLTS